MSGPPRRSAADLVAYGAVVTAIALALLGPPLMGALDPRLPVSVAFHVERAPVDPWGTPWALLGARPWSLGPDRLADEGRGDDVPVLEERHAWLQLYRGGGEALFGLAVVLAVLWELCRALTRQLRAPRGPLATELGRTAALSLPVAALALLLLAFGSRLVPAAGVRSLVDQLRSRLLVPVELALFGTVYAGTLAVLMGVRLRAPTSEDADGAPERGDRQEGAKNTAAPDR